MYRSQVIDLMEKGKVPNLVKAPSLSYFLSLCYLLER